MQPRTVQAINYSATEVTARNGYYLNPGNTTVGQSAAGDASLNLSLANVRTTGSITITKEDSETGAIAQGRCNTVRRGLWTVCAE